MANRQKNGSLFGLSPVVKNIIIINALVWLASVTVFKNSEMLRTLSLHYWESDTFAPFQMITYMFLHDTGNITHLVFNMFNLWMFGCMLENRWGSMRFLSFYFICGIGGALAQQAVWSSMFLGQDTANLINSYYPNLYDILPYLHDGVLSQPITFSDVDATITSAEQLHSLLLSNFTVIGASGAIFGVLIAFAMCYPNMPLYLMFIPIPIKAKYLMIFDLLLEVYLGVSGYSTGIAHFAHLGGAILGIFVILWWRRTGEDPGPM